MTDDDIRLFIHKVLKKKGRIERTYIRRRNNDKKTRPKRTEDETRRQKEEEEENTYEA